MVARFSASGVRGSGGILDLRSVDLSRLGLRPDAVRIVEVFGGKWGLGDFIHVCGLRLYHVRAGLR